MSKESQEEARSRYIRLTILLDPELFTSVRIAAAKQNKGMSQFLREYLKKSCENRFFLDK